MDQDQNEANSSPKQQVAEKIRSSTNVLVTVRSNPSVDELSAAIGLTLMLNKLGKHATAVFSGQTPSTIEFLKPEETIETNTDSLRDFIVSLDKSKADKLRYKVEENVVKIFITPYRTSISQDDLEFTQGDFNVDVVIALGVTQREELDQAIVAHGRILHDATVVTVISGQKVSELGNINWQDAAASSLSEMLVSISEALQGGLIDSQIATAFLTGIVSETERFSNTKTTPKVMTMSAQLMAAGANQQLIANELEKDAPQPLPVVADTNVETLENPEVAKEEISEDGSLSISHTDEPKSDESDQPIESPQVQEDKNQDNNTEQQAIESDSKNESFLPPLPVSEASESIDALVQPELERSMDAPAELPELSVESTAPVVKEDDIHIDHEGNITKPTIMPKHKIIEPLPHDEDINNPINTYLNEQPQPVEQNTNSALDSNGDQQVAEQNDMPSQTDANPTLPEPNSSMPPMPSIPPDSAPPQLEDDTTLLQIEESVHSPHLEQLNQEKPKVDDDVDSARDAVNSAINQADFDPAGQARSDINSQPLGEDLHAGEGQPQYPVEPNVQPQPQVFNPENNQNMPPPVPPPFTGQ